MPKLPKPIIEFTTPFKEYVRHIAPIVKSRRKGKSITVQYLEPRERLVTCKVCGNKVGSFECRNWKGPIALV